MPKISKRVKRIAYSRDRKPAKARRLYKEIASGAREQQRIQRIYEKNFFNPNFESRQLVEEVARFNGSKRQKIELRDYAKRLARKRNWALKLFKGWGLKAEHMGKPMAKTPSGISAKKILYNLSGWCNIEATVEMVPAIDLIAFSVGEKAYNRIIKREWPRTRRTPAFLIPGEKDRIDSLVSPGLEGIRKYLRHERAHVTAGQTPLAQELVWSRKQRFNPRTLVQSFGSTNLRLGTRLIGRGMVDELVANLLEKDIDYFEKKYKKHYLADYSRDIFGPKTASAFMQNKGGHKARLLKATEESIKAVRKAFASYVTTASGKRKPVISRKQLAGLLLNIRDIEKVPRRLPVLIELRRKALKKALGKKRA